MTELVLDCSVTMGWCFDDEADALSERVLELLRDGTAHVPRIWFLEITNVLLTAERRRRIKKSDSVRFFELLRSLPILEESGPVEWEAAERVLNVGRQYGLSAYDATYIDLAMRMGLPLATRDQHLQAACSAAEVALVGAAITEGPA